MINISGPKASILLDWETLQVFFLKSERRPGCSLCSKLLINAGVKKIVYLRDYPDDLAKAFLDEANIPYNKL